MATMTWTDALKKAMEELGYSITGGDISEIVKKLDGKKQEAICEKAIKLMTDAKALGLTAEIGGGDKPDYREYLRSREWKEKRNERLRYDKYKCRECGREAVTVHHLTYERLGNEDIDDLISLCRECHKAKHPMNWDDE